MTQQEIIKALETCYEVGHNCTECPLFSESECNDKLGREVITLLKEQEKRINELEENLKIGIPSKERNDNFDLYDTPIFGFHD
jgi:Zn-finger protein